MLMTLATGLWFGLGLGLLHRRHQPAVVSDWILTGGVWSDSGVWDDSATWID